MKKIPGSLISVIVAITGLCGCDKIDDHRIPAANVNIIFNTIGDWQLYGVTGANQTKVFSRQEGLPANFPYTVAQYTGFGGVLLVCDPNGEFLAYDMACPVERDPEIKVYLDTESEIAGIVKCPECHSTYNLYAMGTPTGGDALKMKYGLEKYAVFVGNSTPPYAYIRR